MVQKPREREVLVRPGSHTIFHRLKAVDVNWNVWQPSTVYDFIKDAAFRGARIKEIEGGL